MIGLLHCGDDIVPLSLVGKRLDLLFHLVHFDSQYYRHLLVDLFLLFIGQVSAELLKYLVSIVFRVI